MAVRQGQPTPVNQSVLRFIRRNARRANLRMDEDNFVELLPQVAVEGCEDYPLWCLVYFADLLGEAPEVGVGSPLLLRARQGGWSVGQASLSYSTNSPQR